MNLILFTISSILITHFTFQLETQNGCTGSHTGPAQFPRLNIMLIQEFKLIGERARGCYRPSKIKPEPSPTDTGRIIKMLKRIKAVDRQML